MTKVALVTGSARGLGLEIASQLLDDGYKVVGVDIAYSEPTQETGSSRGLYEIAADLSLKREVESVVNWVGQKFTKLDLLVNNAMWIHYQKLEAFTEENVNHMLAVGFKAPLWLTQASQRLLADSGGVVINISSVAAQIGIPGSIVYGSIKGAISAMTRHMAVELAPLGIRVNAVAPGYSPTPGVSQVVGDQGEAQRIARTPLGRVCEPEDIAGAVRYLSSPAASFVTGQTLNVDGGISTSL